MKSEWKLLKAVHAAVKSADQTFIKPITRLFTDRPTTNIPESYFEESLLEAGSWNNQLSSEHRRDQYS